MALRVAKLDGFCRQVLYFTSRQSEQKLQIALTIIEAIQRINLHTKSLFFLMKLAMISQAISSGHTFLKK